MARFADSFLTGRRSTLPDSWRHRRRPAVRWDASSRFPLVDVLPRVDGPVPIWSWNGAPIPHCSSDAMGSPRSPFQWWLTCSTLTQDVAVGLFIEAILKAFNCFFFNNSNKETGSTTNAPTCCVTPQSSYGLWQAERRNSVALSETSNEPFSLLIVGTKYIVHPHSPLYYRTQSDTIYTSGLFKLLFHDEERNKSVFYCVPWRVYQVRIYRYKWLPQLCTNVLKLRTLERQQVAAAVPGTTSNPGFGNLREHKPYQVLLQQE